MVPDWYRDLPQDLFNGRSRLGVGVAKQVGIDAQSDAWSAVAVLRLTVTTSTPAAINALAWTWRKLWNLACGTARVHITEKQFGEIGVPSWLGNTSESGSCFPATKRIEFDSIAEPIFNARLRLSTERRH
jgi:hypothetical protein